MSHWNYRVMQFDEDGVSWRAVHTVFYDDEGRPYKYSDDPVGLASEDSSTNNGLKMELHAFSSALNKQSLTPADFPDHESTYSSEGDLI